MDVLVMRQILADDEEVKPSLVYDRELVDDGVSLRMTNGEAQLERPAGGNFPGHSLDVEPVLCRRQ
jgi:hypothetical protein